MVATAVYLFVQIYALLILGRVLMSWVPNLDYSSPIPRFLYEATEPVLKLVRDLLPPAAGFDFSPIIVLITLQMVGQLIVSALS